MATDFLRNFGPLASPVPLSYLDDNFGQLQSASTSTVSLAGASLIGFIQGGAGAVTRPVQGKLCDVVSVKDFGAVGDGTTDDSTAIQTANDALSAGGTLYFPRGSYKITTTLYMKRSGMRWVGDGFTNTNIYFVLAAGGTAIAGHQTNTSTITDCEITQIGFASTAAGTDPSKYLDLTTFAYSRFDVNIQTRRANGVCIYGEGNNGSSPYYNHISGSLFGDSSTQTGIQFVGGAWGGGSNGANANIIGPIRRAAALAYFCDLQVGNGNLFEGINGESIGTAHLRLNSNAAVDSGTSSGSNTMGDLRDTAKSWTVNAYAGYAVKITGGTGSGQVRIIGSNTGTVLSLKHAWGTLPDATSTYAIYKNACANNKFVNLRIEGSSGADFISALPGTQGNRVFGAHVESLGAGLYVRDDSGAQDNTWYDGSRVIVTENVQNPGASADLDLWAKNSVFGGVRLVGSYVVESLSVSANTATLGDTLTVRLDVGGTGPGLGDMTLTVTMPTGEANGLALPAATEKIARDGFNRGLFLNVQTGGSFSATADIQVTACFVIGL